MCLDKETDKLNLQKNNANLTSWIGCSILYEYSTYFGWFYGSVSFSSHFISHIEQIE